jgi:hypothetical protein
MLADIDRSALNRVKIKQFVTNSYALHKLAGSNDEYYKVERPFGETRYSSVHAK